MEEHNDFKDIPAGDKNQARLPLVMIWAVVLVVFGVTMAVLNHARQKPVSPQELVVAAFNQVIAPNEWKPGMGPQPFVYHPAGFGTPPFTAAQEWKPGMGPQPFVYHPAGFTPSGWQSLYLCPEHGANAGSPGFDAAGNPHCPICNKLMVFNR